ncbi:helix-turn-helix transcriptional regulator [Aquisphaera insulae]|uniref:helix-turn-helix transcriptional regulator n=1 Tax=Aquisphaera insulae TaxID=2712864 RepID=UPI0020305F9F|nr:helix-turn-helix domain-containing protein [Aquisphaera insulae]
MECVYTPQSRVCLPWHMHENAYLYLVVSGVCEERLGRKARIVESSSLVFHPAGEPHSNRWDDAGGRVFHIEFSRSRIAAIGEYVPIRTSPTEVRRGPAEWLATRLYREYQKRDDLSPLVMEGLALEILAEISRPGTAEPGHTPPRWLCQARELLHDRFNEPLALNEVATSVGIHPVHLARSFRRHFGCTPGDYLRRIRVEFACHQLAHTDTPLIEIALAAGFADQSHFTRTFRRHMRQTPGEFRRNSPRC